MIVGLGCEANEQNGINSNEMLQALVNNGFNIYIGSSEEDMEEISKFRGFGIDGKLMISIINLLPNCLLIGVGLVACGALSSLKGYWVSMMMG